MPRDLLLLTEMIDAAERIIVLASRLDRENPRADQDVLDALLWNFTVLGEAAGQISMDLKATHPALPWAGPVRLRNRIVHGYWSIDLDILLSTARDDLPASSGPCARSAGKTDPGKEFGPHLGDLVINQLFPAAQTVAELRFGALVAGKGRGPTAPLAQAVSLTTVAPGTDRLIAEVATLP